MKKMFFIVPIFLSFFIFGKTFSYRLDDDETKNYLLTLSFITTNNIENIENCYDKLITIYPDNTYVDIELYNINNINTIKNFKNYYLRNLSNISKTKYYEYKINGIKIKQIKVLTNETKLKKCSNYLEKVEPL